MKALREQSKARTSAKLAKYMKGGSASNCYAGGGTVKTKRSASRESMPVEGKPAKPDLARPGRRMKRASGGAADLTTADVLASMPPSAPIYPTPVSPRVVHPPEHDFIGNDGFAPWGKEDRKRGGSVKKKR